MNIFIWNLSLQTMREVYEQSQPNRQEITATAQHISSPHDKAKNDYLRSITRRPFSTHYRNNQAETLL